MSLWGGIGKMILGGSISSIVDSPKNRTYCVQPTPNPIQELVNTEVKNYGSDLRKEGLGDVIKSTDIYKEGEKEAKKQGYEEASYEYEKKLHAQAEEFINQKKKFEEQREEYDKLLDEYEKFIDLLVEKNQRTEEEFQLLQRLLLDERALKKIQEK